jgi:hypothetical protein
MAQANLQRPEAKTEFASQAVMADYPRPSRLAGSAGENLWTPGNTRDSPLNKLHQERIFLR